MRTTVAQQTRICYWIPNKNGIGLTGKLFAFGPLVFVPLLSSACNPEGKSPGIVPDLVCKCETLQEICIQNKQTLFFIFLYTQIRTHLCDERLFLQSRLAELHVVLPHTNLITACVSEIFHPSCTISPRKTPAQELRRTRIVLKLSWLSEQFLSRNRQICVTSNSFPHMLQIPDGSWYVFRFTFQALDYLNVGWENMVQDQESSSF